MTCVPPASSPPRWAPGLPGGLLGVALVAWLGALVLAWPGYYGMNHASGTVAALADAALRGQGPGHEDGTTFLATVYFPPFPLAVAAVRRLGLPWHDALRVVSLLSALALAAAVGWAARAAGGGRAAAALAVALLLAAAPFKAASLAGRGDLLAAALSIAALAAWLRDAELRGWRAPLLAAAAGLVKATAFTPVLAVAVWTLQGGRGASLARFGPRFALGLAAGLLITVPWHGLSWYADALRTLVVAPPNAFHWLRGPAELVRYAAVYSELAALLALALAAQVLGVTRRSPLGPFSAAALAVTLLVMANRGSDHNHLVEAVGAAAICAGVLAERRLTQGAPLVGALLAVAVAAASWRDVQLVARQTANGAERRAGVLAAIRAEKGAVLAEDPLLALAAGRRPAFSDPATLRSLAAREDPRAMRVIERIRERRFERVVLNQDLGGTSSGWYRDFHMGPAVAGALNRDYRPEAVVDGYHLYRPDRGRRARQ